MAFDKDLNSVCKEEAMEVKQDCASSVQQDCTSPTQQSMVQQSMLKQDYTKLVQHKDIQAIIAEMNYCGAKRIPFLFALNFDLTDGIFITNPQKQGDVFFKTPIGENKSKLESRTCGNYSFSCNPISYEDYLSRFNIIKKGLMLGNSFLTNLTIKTPISTSFSLEDIFIRSNSTYEFLLPEKFVCFSPERFIRIKNGKIFTNPMKGTINASIDDAENKILNDFKETAEHNTIVDLLRNDIGMVAQGVSVERFRYIDRIKSKEREILQVSSEISGTLKEDYMEHLGDIVLKMLPAGSISGAPKRSTINMIKEAEKEPRGFYTGVFGYFDGNELDSAILIRYIEQDEKGNMFFRSGGGITVNSEPKSEYNEVLEKIYLPFV